jgi:MoxR-like ATPase
MQAKYFEYLLTRFTEPNEIFGPVDIAAFRDGVYRRNTAGMLPEAELVFLDEVFKSNSAILNALLTLLNERKYTSGGQIIKCPLISVFAASNEVPGDETLNAVFDRFLLRVRSDNLDAYHFGELLLRGIQHEVRQMRGDRLSPIVDAKELISLGREFGGRMNFSDAFLSAYKGLVFQIRAEGVSLSDRRVVKMLKLFAASAFLDGRPTPDASDFFVLKHIWNNQDQAAILEGIVQPVLEAFFREHPDRRRVGALGVGVEALAAEIDRIRQLLTGGTALGDVQLFSQLKALNEIKAALSAIGTQPAQEAIARVDQLLGHVFQSGKFSQ